MDYVWNKTRETISKKPTYMNNMTSRECTNIFAVRSRMLKVKGNYKHKYTNKTCRWCKDNMETQEHILTQCAGVRSINAKNLLELALEGLDNKTNVSGMLSSFRLYSSVALPDLPGARPYSRVGYIPQFHARCR